MKFQRAYRFVVVSLLILPSSIFSQQRTPLIGQNSPHILNFPENLKKSKFPAAFPNYLSNHGKASSEFVPGLFVLATPGNVETIKSNLSVQHLPFFCKEEFRFEKNTSIPLRLRLGSLDYVNKLEGKK